MRTFLIAVTAAVALAAGPSFAQPDHAAHHPAPAAPATTAADAKAAPDAAPTHEMCMAVMGKQMDAKPVHEHSRDKSGIATWPNGKPLTKAEMEKMHKACAEKMAAAAK